jgi:hypothetical protein
MTIYDMVREVYDMAKEDWKAQVGREYSHGDVQNEELTKGTLCMNKF